MVFEHDIFIGFAPAAGNDNKVTAEWTSGFCKYLALLMDKMSDRKLTFLSHEDMRVRQSVLGENPGTVFTNTAVYVLVLSPEYVNSSVYLQELEDLYNWAQTDKTEAGKKRRIFKVFPQPVPVENQPASLKNEIGYNFFEINRYNKKPITFDLNGKNGPDNKFWSKLVDLAYDILDVLNELTTETSEKPTRDCPAVYLAETTFDQAENRDMLKRELQYLGYRILPVLPVPEDAEKGKQAIDHCLNESVATIHLLGSWYGDFIKNSKLSFIDFQIKTVKDYIASKANIKKPYQIIWIPNDIKPTDQRQSLYLKRLQRDEAQYMTEIIETPFEVFKTILNVRLSEIINPPSKTLADKNKLYVIYEKPSAPKIDKYKEIFRSKGFEILEHQENVDDFFPLTRHISNLLSADAVLIYKGDSTMEWLNSKIRDLVKAPGFGKSKPFRAVEIISMQKTADKSLLFLKNVPVNWDEEINQDVINHFIDHLAKK
jgi:hypothetical protein